MYQTSFDGSQAPTKHAKGVGQFSHRPPPQLDYFSFLGSFGTWGQPLLPEKFVQNCPRAAVKKPLFEPVTENHRRPLGDQTSPGYGISVIICGDGQISDPNLT